MNSRRDPGRLKKNLERSKTPSVERSFEAFSAFSNTGRNTLSALVVASDRVEFIETSGKRMLTLQMFF